MIIESINNIYENRRVFVPFILFMILSFLGIIITDSLIFSSTEAAQDELKINGDDTVTVYFDEAQNQDKISKIFKSSKIELTAEKYAYVRIGETPFKANTRSVHGVEKIDDSLLSDDSNKIIIKNVLFSNHINVLYLNGIPFRIIKRLDKKRTEFLDSLGLNANTNTGSLFIPLKTLSRLTLNNSINAITLRFEKKIGKQQIEFVQNSLNRHNITNYNVHSYIDAKKTVDTVIDRFHILTNTIYILLFLTSCVLLISVCRKNFNYRCTEFAIKIIHGISPQQIALVTLAETIIMIVFSIIASCSTSGLILYQLSDVVGVSINIRLHVLIFTSIIMTMVAIIVNIILGVFLFKKNPLIIIRDRLK
ncbi:hypothetical protein LVD56_004691 [Escherichia coli]|nr:hypothetical protein [Escherichia coli]